MVYLPSPLNLELQLTDEQFLPLWPDFVMKLRPPSDALATTQAKMQDYMDHDA